MIFRYKCKKIGKKKAEADGIMTGYEPNKFFGNGKLFFFNSVPRKMLILEVILEQKLNIKKNVPSI